MSSALTVAPMRADLPPAPLAMQARPLDPRGYPIPWFVHIDDQGVADFRIIGVNKVNLAVRRNLCWLCGRPMRRMKSFVIGPMCAVNRISAEPPSHPECAVFAARACPFLTHPMAKRGDKPGEYEDAPGIMIERNPGVTLVWGCLTYSAFREGSGLLFRIGKPERTQWFAKGRPATRDEVLESIETGLPFLRQVAEAEGAEALSELTEACASAMRLVPKAA
jgi:hypothetical protein